MNQYLYEYNTHIILGQLDEADLMILPIYKELIEDGMLAEEILDADYLYATLRHDYDGYILEQAAMDNLLDGLIEYAEQDEIDEEIVPGLYAGVKYELNLEDGSKERLLLDFAYDGLGEVTDFLAAYLLITKVEIDTLDENKVLGVTDMGTREEIIDVLLSQGDPEFETIADNIPETAEVVMVFTQRDLETGKIVYAEIFTFYEVGNYLGDIEG